LREIAEENIKVSDLTESAVYKLRKHVEQVDEGLEDDEVIGDDFESLYKGEISKSGTPILPSKRARKIPEKLQVSKQDLEDLKGSQEVKINTPTDESTESEVSLEDLESNENQTPEVNQENTEPTNS
jgi:DNA-directed RNA polymerase subunit omega